MSRAEAANAISAELRAAGSVFAEDEAAILVDAAAGGDDGLRALVARRVAGEPLAHVLGWAEFCGLRIGVDPGVFVPRPRTEALVEHAITLARDVSRPIVVDLCCGSGALGVAVAHALWPVELHATDIDTVAVACARRNVEPVGGTVHAGDLDDALPADLRGRVDLLLANVPYVPSHDLESMPRDSRAHEPSSTHDGGGDGLDVARRVARIAPTWLAVDGHVLVELAPAQVTSLVKAFAAAGMSTDVVCDDEWNAAFVVGTRREVSVRASASRAPSAGRRRDP